MAIDRQLKELVLVFEIENKQDSYARCLSTISYFENVVLNNAGDVNSFYSQIRRIHESYFTFHVNQRNRGPNDKMENPINPGEYARIPVSLGEEKELFEHAINSWRREKENLERPLYHIRIKFSYDHDSDSYQNLDNLQFLAMFMQQVYIICFNKDEDYLQDKFTPDKLKKRLCVFLIPHHINGAYQFAGEYPDADKELYLLASQYLRLIAKMHNGVIHGLSLSGKAEAIEFNRRRRNSAFFPLLYLTNIGINNNYQMVFERAGMPKAPIIENSLTYRIAENDPRPFKKAGESTPQEAMADIILDETRARLFFSFAVLSDKFEDDEELAQSEIYEYGKEEISKYVNKIADYTRKCDRFTFALFGYLLFIDRKNKNDEYAIMETIEEKMSLARELGDGIRQIVQNSIQHSQYHACYISFSKVNGINPLNETEEQLWVRVTDLNSQNTITQNFIEKLRKENEYDVFSSNDVKLSLSQLISKFGTDENVLEAWYAYRKKDASAHIGLTMFYNTLCRCQCREMQIISSITHDLQGDDTFTDNFGNAIYNEKGLFPLTKYIIPGTQISFSIPVIALENSSPINLVQLVNNDAFSESYAAFAYYLDYETSLEVWKEKGHIFDNVADVLYEQHFTDAESKIKAQNEWKESWLDLLNSTSNDQKEIHFCDVEKTQRLMEYLIERDKCEVFVKGFFAAASLYRNESPSYKAEFYPSCFYFEYLPAHFVDVLQEVGVPLSLMDFSYNLQVFFSCIDKDDKEESNRQPIRLLALGNCIGHMLQNAYILSLEHGEAGIDTLYYTRASEMLIPYKDKFKPPKEQYVCPFTVFERPSPPNELPQYFIQIAKIADRSLVEENERARGYKFPKENKIHMRLGNKVHADSFYEMSFLFHRTSVANRTAFYIIRKIINEITEADINIVFYGYASYSQALIVSLQEMLQEYFKGRKNNNKTVYYAIYQYNLQSESFFISSQAAIHFGEKKSEFETKDKIQVYSTLGRPENKIPTSVVQIVPIGSTLTTFDKMWAKYCKDRQNFELPKIIANYNVFLVRDENEKNEKGLSVNEDELWDSIKAYERVIKVQDTKLNALKNTPNISYIIMRESKWYKLIECEPCFPKDDVNKEVPLIETDPTSTVPSLQIYQKEYLRPGNVEEISLTCSPSDIIIRLSELLGCVYYGHYIRGKNHFQYYIDTQEYISKPKIRRQLINWLKDERNKEIKRTFNEKEIDLTPVLNIIFSPEHNTSVGFSQFVNTYFFNGTAEIVSVNVDKQFRSNFICEHDALQQTINRLLGDFKGSKTPPVRFFFADDAINSGGSYRRANDLLKSLIPEKHKNKYPNPVFSKCFVLVDRLSSTTHESYIDDPKNNFLSFCRINISNMRTQGDSCVGCKLVDEARHLFKRSSTRSFANYWAKKTQDSSPVMFDDLQGVNKFDRTKSFVRMLLTHVIENFIQKNKYESSSIIKLFDIILYESMKPILYENIKESLFLDDEETALIKITFRELSNIEIQTKEKEKIQNDAYIITCLLEHAIKILSRPFLSYNLEVKKYVLRLLIQICESLLTNKANSKLTKKITDVLKNAKPDGVMLLYFVKNCLFEALADIKSTYLLRKETIMKAYKFTNEYANLKEYNSCSFYENDKCIEYVDGKTVAVNCHYPCNNKRIRCFWKKYAFHIHKIIDSSGDETRSLWMEHLFAYGNEFPMKNDINMESFYLPLFESIIEKDNLDEETKQFFKEFCMEIFLQNSRLLYDGIEKFIGNTPGIEPSVNSYFLQNMKDMRRWDFNWAGIDPIPISTIKERNMFKFFGSNGNNEKDTDIKYQSFIETIINMVEAKYVLDKDSLRIALVTQKSNGVDDMSAFEILKDNIPKEYSSNRKIEAKYIIKQRIIWALGNKVYSTSRLEDDGYCLIIPPNKEEQGKLEEEEFDFTNDSNTYRKPFFILRFDNIPVSGNIHLGRDAQPIDIVYLYFSFIFNQVEKKKEKAVPILIMRDILSYRNRIMRMLEKDFNSHLMQMHAHKIGENTVLKHEKTVSHTLTSDDQLPKRLWKKNGQLGIDEYEWLLFRNYTNTQIAKLFNRTLLSNDEENKNNDNDESLKYIPKLYLGDNDIDKNEDDDFALPARYFFKDLFDDKDRRIFLCKEIIKFYPDNELEKEELVSPKDKGVKGYFNREYLKCVLFDIFLSCAKYWDGDINFLSRIKRLIKYQEKCNEISEKNDPEYSYSLDAYNRLMCKVFLFREENNLVIINPVNITDNYILDGWKERNQRISIKIQNPIDSFDGHMSLFTINKYISKNVNETPTFEYKPLKEMNYNWKTVIQSIQAKFDLSSNDDEQLSSEPLWFISSLPIFTKGN
jgi:hypothetical protein